MTTQLESSEASAGTSHPSQPCNQSHNTLIHHHPTHLTHPPTILSLTSHSSLPTTTTNQHPASIRAHHTVTHISLITTYHNNTSPLTTSHRPPPCHSHLTHHYLPQQHLTTHHLEAIYTRDHHPDTHISLNATCHHHHNHKSLV
ncbi:hypothetical protein Pcinc_036568 [Petrolisthes cinctipes]|uniref:Uncharacterized protein n=1 Tax=Petrolisthes cinctipes TaxID=88211 RepID=A0AAE1ENJ4_PETCI|nr:hypothetical protein Pcinc_036568 [Petrolisthes cinctipes]